MKKLHIRLFEGAPTIAQQTIIGLWAILLFAVVGMWGLTSASLLSSGASNVFLSIGLLIGLLATFFALTQFMLMGRIWWIESAFGLDRLASYHRFNGYAAIILILLHAPLITASYALRSSTNYFQQYIELLTDYTYVGLAGIAVVLFVGVVASSIYIARRHLKFETWYWVHLAVYAAIVLASLHQFAIGSSLQQSTLAYYFWLGLYLFVALNFVIWRFGLPVFNMIRFGFTVDRVIAETPTTTSVYIRGKNLKKFKTVPGQFVLVRFLARSFGLEEHPFSLSMTPEYSQAAELRLTIRHVGDYTGRIAQIKAGTKVVISGPFGRFTRKVSHTKKRLYIAGGVGITPIRTMFEESVHQKVATTLLYGNKDSSDVPLKKELDAISTDEAKIHYVYSDETRKDAESGRINAALIKRLVADVAERDVYVCGPPPMMASVVEDLRKLNVPTDQIHFEQFSLHA
jgi:predicted ferric reductase